MGRSIRFCTGLHLEPGGALGGAGFGYLMRRLDAFTRLIMFDKCGTGLSDRVDAHHLPTLETRTMCGR